MSIRYKILIPMIVLTLIAASAVLVSNIIQFSSYIESSMETTANTAASVAMDEFNNIKEEAMIASKSLADSADFIEAFESGDRNTILLISGEVLRSSNMDFCSITDAQGIVVARPHAPANYGDSVTAMPSVKSAMGGTPLMAIELGSSVRMSICAANPIYNESGSVIGVVVMGYRLDTTAFVDNIKKMLDCEVTIFVGDERISTTVLKDDGTRAVGTKASEEVSKTVLGGEVFSGRTKILDKDALTRYSPLFDPNGTAIGMLFVGRYSVDEVQTIGSFVQVGIIITALMLALSVIAAMAIAGRITNPIKKMVEMARSLAAGDTDLSISVKTKDEMLDLSNAFTQIVSNTRDQVKIVEAIAKGDLTVTVNERSDKDVMNNALNTMLTLNNEVFEQIVSSVNQVAASTRQVANSSQSLAQGSTQQAAAVEQLSSSITEIAQKTANNAEKADRAAKLAGAIKNSAEKGNRQMDEMMTAVREINHASQSINKVIKAIDDIAFQTNILALNASVEAARAGQHGKGFAVVAGEVRSLAAKSAEAAKETGDLIANSIEKAELGAQIADNTAASLVEIVAGINESSLLVGEIASASEEQALAISEINKGIEQVSMVIQQNSATAEESAAASEEMNGQTDMLEGLMKQFKLRSDENADRKLYSTSFSPVNKTSRNKPTMDNTMSNGEGESYLGKY